MDVTIALQEDEVAFIDAIARYTGGDRSSAMRIAISTLREQASQNGPMGVTGFGHPHAAMNWRQIDFLKVE